MPAWFSKNKTQNRAGEKTGYGCFFIFLLPFCGVAIFALANSIRLFSQGDWKQGALTLLFGIVFGAFGFGLMAALFYGGRETKKVAARQKEFADQPWLWREDWANREMRSSPRNQACLLAVFAIIWCAMSSALFFVLPKEIAKGNKAAWIGFIFPLVGIVLLFVAGKFLLRWKRYGDSVFRPLEVPAPLGGQLTGLIQSNVKLPFRDGILLTLSCMERDTSGDNTTEKILWQEEKTIIRDFLEAERNVSGIPVRFDIPVDLPESSPDKAKSLHIVWRLHAASKATGVKYEADFEVPVFRVQNAAAPSAPAPALSAFEAPPEPFNPTVSKIRITPVGTKGVEIFAPSRRNGSAIPLLIFTIIWWGVVVVMLRFGSPIIFPIVFGLFGTLITWALVEFTLISTRATIADSMVTVERRWLWRSVKRSLLTPNVKASLDINFQQGKSPYYDVVLKLEERKRIPLVKFIRHKAEAEWVLSHVEKCL